MVDDFVPVYREVKSFKDVDYNQQQMIRAFNHSMSKMAEAMNTFATTSIRSANDIKWIKRFVFGLCGLIGIIVVSVLFA